MEETISYIFLKKSKGWKFGQVAMKARPQGTEVQTNTRAAWMIHSKESDHMTIVDENQICPM